jgi:hypothetical protein
LSHLSKCLLVYPDGLEIVHAKINILIVDMETGEPWSGSRAVGRRAVGMDD